MPTRTRSARQPPTGPVATTSHALVHALGATARGLTTMASTLYPGLPRRVARTVETRRVKRHTRQLVAAGVDKRVPAVETILARTPAPDSTRAFAKIEERAPGRESPRAAEVRSLLMDAADFEPTNHSLWARDAAFRAETFARGLTHGAGPANGARLERLLDADSAILQAEGKGHEASIINQLDDNGLTPTDRAYMNKNLPLQHLLRGREELMVDTVVSESARRFIREHDLLDAASRDEPAQVTALLQTDASLGSVALDVALAPRGEQPQIVRTLLAAGLRADVPIGDGPSLAERVVALVNEVMEEHRAETAMSMSAQLLGRLLALREMASNMLSLGGNPRCAPHVLARLREQARAFDSPHNNEDIMPRFQRRGS